MNKPETLRQSRINNCGKEKRWVSQEDATVKAITLFCGYYKDCPTCYKTESNKRSLVIKETLGKSPAAFRTEIDDAEWKRLRRKLASESIDSYRITLQNGHCIVIAASDPGVKDINFVEVSPQEAIDELTQEEYLFTEKRRGFTGDWRRMDKEKQYCRHWKFP